MGVSDILLHGIAKLTSKPEQNHLYNLKQQRFAKQ